ncbi:hypothetical protein C1H46_006871 [Malus baccata]|uniref:Uncharacterized protein n=1 Tax=Malus baccata TaxID=106549 RepID=A0A540N924_MALBA|nr:hypothetical protein C1H46_006871 [Malus baccata]
MNLKSDRQIACLQSKGYHDNAFVTSRALHIVNQLKPSATFPLLEWFFKNQERYYNAQTRNISRVAVVNDIVNSVTEVIGNSYHSALEFGFNDRKTDLKTRVSFKGKSASRSRRAGSLVSLELKPTNKPGYHDNAFVTSRALHIVNQLKPSATFPLLEWFFKNQERYYNAQTRNISRVAVVNDIVNSVTEVIGNSYHSALEFGFNDRKTDLKTRVSFKAHYEKCYRTHNLSFAGVIQLTIRTV